MESKAKAFGHPIHPMLIPFPLGLLATSLVFDVIYLISNDGKWAQAAFWMIGAGIVGGLIAAPFGTIDYLAIPGGTRAKSIGQLHGIGNLVVIALFAVGWWLRRDDPRDPGSLPVVLSVVGVILAAITGWLGGELVDRLGVGVDRGANINAPSSLSGSLQRRSPARPGAD